jgi:hypothetical protein
MNQIKIVDITGKIILAKTFVGQTMEIDLSTYSSGLYYLLVDGSEGHKSCKLVKK